MSAEEAEKIRALAQRGLTGNEAPAQALDAAWSAIAATILAPPPSPPPEAARAPPPSKIGIFKMVAALTIVAGGAGLAIHGWQRPTIVPPVRHEETAIEAAPPSTEPKTPPVLASPRIDKRTRPNFAASTPVTSSAASVPVSSSLAEEILLLARAQKALSAGDGDAALALVAQHEAHFSTGQLREERDLVRVKVLTLQGKDEAQSRAEAFLRAYPKSAHRDEMQQLIVP